MTGRLKIKIQALGRSKERGIALVIVTMVLILLTLLVTSSLYTMVMETTTSGNYRNSNQAYYAAEAGIQRTIDWFSHQYAPADLPGLQDSLYPVKLSNQFITLDSAGGSTYPDSGQVTSFTNFLTTTNIKNITLPSAGNITCTYRVIARLLSSKSALLFLSGQGRIERWRIESTGMVTSGTVTIATSQVATIIETISQPFVNKAICASGFDFSSSSKTDSFDSSTGTTTLSNTDASVGTFSPCPSGDCKMSGSSTISGEIDVGGSSNLSGGSCTPGAVPGSTLGCNDKNFCNPLPSIPTYCASANNSRAANTPNYATSPNITYYALPNICSGGGCPTPSNTADAGSMSINTTIVGKVVPQPGVSGDVCFWFNDITISGGKSFTFDNLAGRSGNGKMSIYVDQFVLSGGSTLVVNSDSANPIYLFVKSRYDSSGGSISNSPLNDAGFFIIFVGTTQMAYSGGSGSGAVIISTNPAANVVLSGASGLYGAIYAAGSVTLSGGSGVHFDRALKDKLVTIFNFTPQSEVRRIQ